MSGPLAYHLTLASKGRGPLFPTAGERRATLRKLARICREELVLFCLVDDHLHLVLRCAKGRVGRIARALALALGCQLDWHSEPVLTRKHLLRLVLYVLQQVIKHQLNAHPALWEGSCFQELIGARCLFRIERLLTQLLPRFRLREAYWAVGLSGGPVLPASDEVIRRAGPARLASAAACVLAIGPGYGGRSAAVARARRAAAQLGRDVGFPDTLLAEELGVTSRGLRKMRRALPEEEVQRAIRIRLALEEAIAAQGGGAVACQDAPAQLSSPGPVTSAGELDRGRRSS